MTDLSIKDHVWFSIYRYQKTDYAVRGCLFLNGIYLCDTMEHPDAHLMPGYYMLRTRYIKRVSLGGGFYDPGETRVYVHNSDGSTAHTRFIAAHGRPKSEEICVGYRNEPYNSFKQTPYFHGEGAMNTLAMICNECKALNFFVLEGQLNEKQCGFFQQSSFEYDLLKSEKLRPLILHLQNYKKSVNFGFPNINNLIDITNESNKKQDL